MTNSKLTEKLAEILGQVGRVKKNGRNEFHKYDYVLEADLVEAVRDKLAAAKIFIYTIGMRTEVLDVSKVLKTGEVAISKVPLLFIEYAFVDGESGEEKRVWGVGEIDQDGGKGIYKAQTGAEKYMLMKNFLIATGDDPERDDRKAPQDAKKAPQAGGSQAKAQNAVGAVHKGNGDFPSTNAQQNAIMRHWGEMYGAEQVQLQDFLQKKGIPPQKEQMTKRQASAVLDEITRIKNGRGSSNGIQ